MHLGQDKHCPAWCFADGGPLRTAASSPLFSSATPCTRSRTCIPMGASDSKLTFKQGIFRLSEPKQIPADDAYWTGVRTTS
jgi:hypothetical protein